MDPTTTSPQLNELVKQGSAGAAKGTGYIGAKLMVDSARHLSQVHRLTLDSGISLSPYGLDLNNQGSIQNAKEIFVETLHVKNLDVVGGYTPAAVPEAATPAPAPATLPMAIELPDDMMLESLQINNTLQLVPSGGQNHIGGNSLLRTDSTGIVVPGPVSTPGSYLTTDAQNHLQWVAIPPAVVTPTPPVPVDLVRVQVAIPDHIPRFLQDGSAHATLSSTSVKIDEADNVTGINKLETLELSVAELLQVDQIRASGVNAPVMQTQKLNLGVGSSNTAGGTTTGTTTAVYETNMYVSNGPFQNIGISGEGAYIFNLKIEDNTFSLYGTLCVGKTKVAYRSSFGAALGGVKSTQLEEHESEGGYDYVVANLPDLGKIYLGVEQKTAELVVKTNQEQLLNMDICVQKTSAPWNRKGN